LYDVRVDNFIELRWLARTTVSNVSVGQRLDTAVRRRCTLPRWRLTSGRPQSNLTRHSSAGSYSSRYVSQDRTVSNNCAFSGSQNQNLTFTPSLSQNRYFRVRFRRYFEIFARWAYTMQTALNVIVAP